MRGRHPRHSEELAEPEMLPMMNVLFILVLALMGMSTFIPLGVISTQAPRLAGPGEGPTAGGAKLNLTVMLQKNGINLSIAGAMETGAFPMLQGPEGQRYNFEALTDRLARLKAQYPNETRVLIMADPDVIYDDIVKVMDATRTSKEGNVMFPEVAFVPGVIN